MDVGDYFGILFPMNMRSLVEKQEGAEGLGASLVNILAAGLITMAVAYLLLPPGVPQNMPSGPIDFFGKQVYPRDFYGWKPLLLNFALTVADFYIMSGSLFLAVMFVGGGGRFRTQTNLLSTMEVPRALLLAPMALMPKPGLLIITLPAAFLSLIFLYLEYKILEESHYLTTWNAVIAFAAGSLLASALCLAVNVAGFMLLF